MNVKSNEGYQIINRRAWKQCEHFFHSYFDAKMKNQKLEDLIAENGTYIITVMNCGTEI
jgi:hypothetical protein